MDDCLIKPIRPSTLLAIIARMRKERAAARGRVVATGRPVLDRAALLERVDGDMALLSEMTDAFLRDYERLMTGARDSIARRNSHDLASALHTLCGMFRNLSADAAWEAAMELQRFDLTSDPAGAAERLAVIEEEVQLLNAQLASLHLSIPRAGIYAGEPGSSHGNQTG